MFDINTKDYTTIDKIEGELQSVDISENGKFIIATVYKNKTVWLRLVSGNKYKKIKFDEPKWVMKYMCISKDGQNTLNWSDKGLLEYYNIEEKIKISDIHNTNNQISSIHYSPNMKFIACGSYDCTVNIWNLNKLNQKICFKGHSNWVRVVSFSFDHKYIASASDDKTIKVWNLQTKTEEFTLSGHSDWIRTIAFSVDRVFLASGSDDCSIKIWNLETKSEEFSFEGLSDRVSFVKFSSNRKALVSGLVNGTLLNWDLEKKKVSFMVSEEINFWNVGFSRTGNYFACRVPGGFVKIWKVGCS